MTINVGEDAINARHECVRYKGQEYFPVYNPNTQHIIGARMEKGTRTLNNPKFYFCTTIEEFHMVVSDHDDDDEVEDEDQDPREAPRPVCTYRRAMYVLRNGRQPQRNRNRGQ